MSFNDELVSTLKCCLGAKNHFLREPLLLKCNHSACKSCIEKKNGREFTCEFTGCGKKYKMKKVDKLQANTTAQKVFEEHKSDLIEMIRKDFNKLLFDLQEINIENMIDANCDLVELEIDIKIESLKNELNDIGDFMRKRVNGLREQMKCLIPKDEVEATKEYLKDTNNLFINSPECENVYEAENHLQMCKQRIEIMTGYIPKLPFQSSGLDINESFVGNINDIIFNPPEVKKPELKSEEVALATEPCKFETISKTNSMYVAGRCLTRIAYIENKDEIVVCDSEDKALKIIDSKTMSFITQVNPDRLLDCPVAITTNSNGDIFVGDYTHAKIFVYDEYFDYLRSFGAGVIQKPFYMIIDNENDNLYVCDKRNNTISVWNTLTDEHLHDINCVSPTHAKVSNDQLIVVSGVDYQVIRNTSKLKNLIKGQNCINIFNKTTREVLNVIKLNSWFDLRGLCIDNFQCIYTIAHEINTQKIISDKTYLFKFDSNGKFIKKTRMDANHIRDMIQYDNKIVFARGNAYPIMSVIQFN